MKGGSFLYPGYTPEVISHYTTRPFVMYVNRIQVAYIPFVLENNKKENKKDKKKMVVPGFEPGSPPTSAGSSPLK